MDDLKRTRKMKIAAITGNRSDYDLMSYLYRRLNRDDATDFGLIVTGAHLMPGYENAVEEMRRDGNNILAEINDITGGDALKDRAAGIGLLMGPLTDALESFAPDLLIGVGDREEVPAAALAAAYMKIPFMHFFGGDFVPDGHPDNLARAAASTLATVHMVSLEEHRERLLAMGEPDFRIHVIGSIALDKYTDEPALTRRALLDSLGLTDFDEYAIVLYHPPTDIEGENTEIRNILRALADKGIHALVSYPNTDAGNSSVIAAFDRYKEDSRFYFYRNFDRNTFVNVLRNASFQIGNSSAGICESASVPLPVINVGSRNGRRASSGNVLFTDGRYDSIAAAIEEARGAGFAEKLHRIENIYGDGRSSEKAYELIKRIDYGKILLKKEDPLFVKEME
jgi:GDP/UDP-N,N'-diacetylbacillosamine 2-epimerase (hydrolysing)